jgi:hypothetical protein
MTTSYSPGCKDDKAHQCDMCENADGRPTLYWPEKDFDLCYECIFNLYGMYIPNRPEPIILISRLRITEELRNEIFERDLYKCKACGNGKDLCIDHIIPFGKGGKTEKDNLQVLCKKCNLAKRTK